MLKHWKDVDGDNRDEWPARWFSPQEIACRGSGMVLLTDRSRDALRRLDALREAMGHPLYVTSGYRSPEHNRRVGGAKASKHMEGIAFDISMANVDPHRFEREARQLGFNGIGLYPPQKPTGAKNFIHIDTRPAPGWRGAKWGEFPARASRFAEEEPAHPVRNAVADASPTLATGGAIFVAVEAAEPALREAAPWLPEHWRAAVYLAIAALAVYMAVTRWRRARDE